MIGYTTVGTSQLSRAGEFYDKLLGALGGRRLMAGEDFIVWAFEHAETHFSLHMPFDRQAQTVGNGVMIALSASSPEQVAQLHEKALKLGAENEGDPGYRQPGFYAAYFRDLDGNKLNFHCIAPTSE